MYILVLLVLSFMLSFVGCYHSCYHFMLSFFTVSKCYHFYVIIFPCTNFVLLFMLSFDVIIFHDQQMLSFLCYNFALYIFCVIIYVIIWCYHLLLSFPPSFFFLKTWHTRKENVWHSGWIVSFKVCRKIFAFPRQLKRWLSVEKYLPTQKKITNWLSNLP